MIKNLIFEKSKARIEANQISTSRLKNGLKQFMVLYTRNKSRGGICGPVFIEVGYPSEVSCRRSRGDLS